MSDTPNGKLRTSSSMDEYLNGGGLVRAHGLMDEGARHTARQMVEEALNESRGSVFDNYQRREMEAAQDTSERERLLEEVKDAAAAYRVAFVAKSEFRLSMLPAIEREWALLDVLVIKVEDTRKLLWEAQEAIGAFDHKHGNASPAHSGAAWSDGAEGVEGE